MHHFEIQAVSAKSQQMRPVEFGFAHLGNNLFHRFTNIAQLIRRRIQRHPKIKHDTTGLHAFVIVQGLLK
ncbi:hypothetical protein D3C80_2185650 [compost metagenome]